MIRFDRLILPGSAPFAIAAALLVSLPGAAQDFAACTRIADDQQRLACFDRAAHAMPPAPASPAFTAPVAPASPPPGTFSPFAGTAPSAPNPVADFGRSSVPVTAPPPRPPDEPAPINSITARVIQIIDPDGKPTFVLDNNQTWISVKYIHIVPRSKGPNTVKIESAAVGYLMTLNDASFQFGVRRLK
jgi:hypothetical protein